MFAILVNIGVSILALGLFIGTLLIAERKRP